MTPATLRTLRPVVRDHLSWAAWEARLERRGVTIDRPTGTAHPDYPSIRYPLDYGYIPNTTGPDGEPVDVFVGSEAFGLVGTLLTVDYRRGDRELKLLYDCTPAEVYTAHGFLNYDRTLAEGILVLRHSMPTLWERHREAPPLDAPSPDS